ncbi:diacylglycerol kinase [Pseudogracilibacillus auburnensis]|uniref:Diacylglycerol kinase n=1 Tax=Pseudogracilibacillus auburnensis TaxID=1494959 RepID=A0A2V3WAT0_9BACI|nr:diacylglycerol kinase [Pseudogracilibacillus auburnensis]MBO1001201.1 diacylglycerol kinase [Pseudogracilibacillus auburnensis]PXW90636.1 diacylglycerol kinase [Pseudogracilibacillus auburnensis]
MKRARIIYNPTAGRELFRKELPKVLERFEQAGYETSAHATVGEGDATNAAEIAVEREYDIVIVAGGDGTINEVVHGIAGSEYRPKLGIIPVGTTNDFARALSIPRDIKKAVDIILKNNAKALDIGKVNDHYFINIAGGGDLTELTYDVPIKLKSAIGQLAYYMKGIEMLPFLRPVSTTIEYDDQIFEGDIMLFLVANTNSVGGFEKLAPDALIDDGYFDLLILKKTNLAEFLRIATAGIRGAHIEDENIIYTQAKRIKVTPKEKMQLNVDGEFGGLLPGEIVNLNKHIQFFVSDEFLAREAEIKNRLLEKRD